MKELSIEEKARRYDEAIEIAKNINNEQRAQPFNIMTRVFPELAESEDERIRKEMIETLKNEAHEFPSSIIAEKSKSWIAWLEKQVEQKHIPWYDLEKSKEAGYTIVPNEEYDRLTKPAEWSEEDEAVLDALTRRLEGEDIYVSPHLAVKCLKNLKGRVQLQPRQKWSEEDENMLKFILTDYRTRGAKEDSDIITWLKSLRPQPQWKQSDEHYELEEFAKIVRGNLTGISEDVQEQFEAKYLQLTGNRMYGGFKD